MRAAAPSHDEGTALDHATTDLVDSIYDAALRPEGWAKSLELVAKLVEAQSANLVILQRAEAPSLWAVVRGVDLASYSDYYAQLDPWATSSSRMPVGSIGPSEAQCPEDRLVRTEFYCDFLRPTDLHHGFGATLARGPGDGAAFLSGLRAKRQGSFRPEELARIETVIPHFQRALELARRFDTLRAECEASASLLDRLPAGIILLDRGGRIVRANRAADRILRARDGLCSDRDGLRAASGDLTARLRALVADAARCADGRGGGVLRLPRRSGEPALSAVVSPARRGDPVWQCEAAVAVVVSDGAALQSERIDYLREVYELTPSEARLALLIARGFSLEEAARLRGIAVGTARTQLKQVLAKTRTQRQAELVTLLLSGPLPLVDPEPR